MARVKGVSRNAQLLEVGGPFPAPSTLLRIRIARGVVINAMCKLLRWIVKMITCFTELNDFCFLACKSRQKYLGSSLQQSIGLKL